MLAMLPYAHVNRPRDDMTAVLRKLGLLNDLKLVLDAGDEASFSSGQKWLDRSGGGYDFFLGPDGSATAADPTFNGTAGRRSSGEFFSGDGGDYFRYDSANEAWMKTQHKDGAVFTYAGWVFLSSGGGARLFATYGTGAASPNPGYALFFTGSNLRWLKNTAPSGSEQWTTSGALAPGSQWAFGAISLDEPNGNLILQVNGTQDVRTGIAYGASSTTDPLYTLEVIANGNGALPQNGQRCGALFAWQPRALTSGELMALFQATRGKYGI